MAESSNSGFLILGINGSIGGAFALALCIEIQKLDATQRPKVRAMVRQIQSTQQKFQKLLNLVNGNELPSCVEFVQGDAQNKEDIEKAMEGCGYIFFGIVLISSDLLYP